MNDKDKRLERLSKITQVILDEDTSFLELKHALEKLKLIFLNLLGLNFDTDLNQNDIFLDSGKAIGPRWASMCINDIMRTKRFICGVNKAIQNLKKTKKSKPLQLLYVGPGPFATLVMPLITLYSPSEIQFTLLEINPLSIKSLKNVIKGCNAEAYIKHIYQCDASIFTLPNPGAIDILLAECLQHALIKEPQVAIMYNLLPQLKDDVVLIPQRIALHVALINTESKLQCLLNHNGNNNNARDYYKNCKAVFTLDKESVLNNKDVFRVKNYKFLPVTVLFSEEDMTQYNQIAINTEIIVYDSEILDICDSGLTAPLIIHNLNTGKNIKGVVSQYIANNLPRLQTSFMD